MTPLLIPALIVLALFMVGVVFVLTAPEENKSYLDGFPVVPDEPPMNISPARTESYMHGFLWGCWNNDTEHIQHWWTPIRCNEHPDFWKGYDDGVAAWREAHKEESQKP